MRIHKSGVMNCPWAQLPSIHIREYFGISSAATRHLWSIYRRETLALNITFCSANQKIRRILPSAIHTNSSRILLQLTLLNTFLGPDTRFCFTLSSTETSTLFMVCWRFTRWCFPLSKAICLQIRFADYGVINYSRTMESQMLGRPLPSALQLKPKCHDVREACMIDRENLSMPGSDIEMLQKPKRNAPG